MCNIQYMDYSTPSWKVCNADSAKDFSAIGYYTAKRIQKILGVPVGVIGCNWGCRKIESFIPTWAFNREKSLVDYKNNYETSLLEKSQEDSFRNSRCLFQVKAFPFPTHPKKVFHLGNG